MSTFSTEKNHFHAVLLAFLFLASFALTTLSGCNRESSEEAIGKGQTALIGGEYKTAARHLKRAVKLNPGNDIILYNLGMAQMLATDYKAADRSFDEADQVSKDGSTDALEALAETRRLAGDPEGAIRAIERAFSKVNRKAHLVAGLAVCEMEQGHNEYAHQLLQEALDTDDLNPVALFNMAVLLQKPQFNKPTKAADLFSRFITSAESAKFETQKLRAIDALREINASRSEELQMQIDNLLMKARTAKTKNDTVNLTVEAVLLDRSNPDSMQSLIKALKDSGRTQQATALLTNFKDLFPNNLKPAN